MRRSAEGDRICSRCAGRATRCNCCLLPLSRGRVLTDNGWVCESCDRRYFYECNDCATLINSGSYCENCTDLRESDDDEDGDCDCEVCRPSSYGPTIHSYSYRPQPHFFGRGPLYLGVELEIGTPISAIEGCATVAARHLESLGYLKQDGSLESGFEIVTHPMSHDYARQRFPWPMLESLREHGAAPDHSTGLHVHVSRAAFDSAAHVYRWLKFLHRNNEQVCVIARRRSDQWAAWSHEDRRRAKDYAKGDRGSDRYRAINVTNEDTFEVRVFASTLDRQELQAALDLVAASVEYTRGLTVADIYARDGWQWAGFAAWAAARPEYAALARECGAITGQSGSEALACAC
jgi:hypothetical protein